MKIKIRWLMLGLGIVVGLPAIAMGQVKEAIISFLIGMPYGILIDYILGKLLGLWDYAGGMGKEYLLITVPCWGIFSMAINLTWDWINWIGGNLWIAWISITLVLFIFLEGPNLLTRSWTYHKAPLWLIVLGWFPLVLSFRILYIVYIFFFS